MIRMAVFFPIRFSSLEIHLGCEMSRTGVEFHKLYGVSESRNDSLRD